MKDMTEIKVIKILKSQQYPAGTHNVAASGDDLKTQNVSSINKEQERLVW